MKRLLFAIIIGAAALCAQNNAPSIIAADGTYLGKLSASKLDPDSISNPYGVYGSKYSPTSINNPYGPYGDRYSPYSVNNPYATGGRVSITTSPSYNWNSAPRSTWQPRDYIITVPPPSFLPRW